MSLFLFPDSSQASQSSGCFTANSTVQTSTGITRRLDELKVGEKILSIDSSGNTVYSEVLMFLDRNTNQTREFVKIKTDGGAIITVTPAHLLMVWLPTKQITNYFFADKIVEGHYLLVNINGTLVPQRIIHITAVLSRGIFAPLTSEGTVIVDSIAASCYALVDNQSLIHWSFMPYRFINKIVNWLSQNYQPAIPRKNGIHWYAEFLYSIKDYVLPPSMQYR